MNLALTRGIPSVRLSGVCKQIDACTSERGKNLEENERLGSAGRVVGRFGGEGE